MAHENVFDRDRRIRNANLTMGQTFYLCTLNQFVGKNTEAWPIQAKIAERMNASIRSVKYWQAELEQLGVIVVASGKRCKKSNRYSLNLDALQVKPTLNSATTALFGTDSDPERGNHCTIKGATIAPGKGQPLPTERTKKEHKKEQGAAFPILFPEKLNNQEFKNAWSEWVQFRKEINKKLTPTTVTKQLAKLNEWGSKKAIQSIENSICNTWQGLFEPDSKLSNGNATVAGAASDVWTRIVKVCVAIRVDDPTYPQQLIAAFGKDIAEKIMTLKVIAIRDAADARSRGNGFRLKELAQQFQEMVGAA